MAEPMTFDEGARALAELVADQSPEPDDAGHRAEGAPDDDSREGGLSLEEGGKLLLDQVRGVEAAPEETQAPEPGPSPHQREEEARRLTAETEREQRAMALAEEAERLSIALEALNAAMWAVRADMVRMFGGDLTVEGVHRLAVADPQRHGQLVQLFERLQRGQSVHQALTAQVESVRRQAFALIAAREDERLLEARPELRHPEAARRTAQQVAAMLKDLGIADDAYALLGSSPVARDYRVQQILIMAGKWHAMQAGRHKQKRDRQASRGASLSMEEGARLMTRMLT